MSSSRPLHGIAWPIPYHIPRTAHTNSLLLSNMLLNTPHEQLRPIPAIVWYAPTPREQIKHPLYLLLYVLYYSTRAAYIHTISYWLDYSILLHMSS